MLMYQPTSAASRASDASRASRAQLGYLGMSLLTKALRISTPGPNAVKLNATPSIVKKAIAVAGPALSAIPGYGTLLAAGAAVITAADQKMKQSRLQQAASASNAQDLLQQYSDVAGQIPGRVIGLPLIGQIWEAMVSSGGFHSNGAGQAAWVKDAINGCKGCGPNTLANVIVPKALSAGVTNAAQILDQFNIPALQATAKNKWAIPGTPLERQIVIDAIDALVAQQSPGAPLSYGQPAADAPPPPPPMPLPAPSTAAPPASTPIPLPPPTTAPPPAIITGPPSSTVPTTTPAAIPPAIADNTRQLIDALLAQGATQAQAFSGAMQSLAASGVQATPQVQQAVAEEVKAKSAVPWPWIIGGGAAGILVLTFVLTRRRSDSRRSR